MGSNVVCLAFLILMISQPLRAETEVVDERKSAGKAVALSLASTLVTSALAIPFLASDIPESNWNEAVGGTLLASGLIIGPGAGHIYAQNRKAFYRGVVIRAIGAGILLGGVAKKESIFDDDATAEFFILTGGTIVLISMISDIARVDGSARRYNKEHGLLAGLYPIIQVGPSDVRLILSLRL